MQTWRPSRRPTADAVSADQNDLDRPRLRDRPFPGKAWRAGVIQELPEAKRRMLRCRKCSRAQSPSRFFAPAEASAWAAAATLVCGGSMKVEAEVSCDFAPFPFF